MATVMTAAYIFCGLGQPFSMTFSCQGPSCINIQQMPNVSCITAEDGVVLCNNNVACGSSSNFSSTFLLTQNGTTIVNARQLIVAGQTVAQTDTLVASATPSTVALAAKLRTSHARPRYSASMLVTLLLWVSAMLIPCAFAASLHPRAFAPRQIDNPVQIPQIISDIYTSTSPSEFSSTLFQQIAENLCTGTVDSILQTLSGPLTEVFVRSMTTVLLDACITGLKVLPFFDPPFTAPEEVLVSFAGSIFCNTIVNTIVSLPFDVASSEACNAVLNMNMTSPTTTSIIAPSPTAGPSPGCYNCNASGENCCQVVGGLAPTCICGGFGDCSQFGSPNNTSFCPAQ